jgi:hypothetical protein
LLGCADRRCDWGDKDIDFGSHKFVYQIGNSFLLARSEPILDDDIFPFDITEFPHSPAERLNKGPGIGGIATPRKKANAWNFPRLLRLDRKAERKEHSAKRKEKDFVAHAISLFLLPTALCSLLSVI